MSVFYIADLHLGHENIIKYDRRPFDSVTQMDETITANWNSRVGENDTVYILGDLTKGKESDWPGILRSLNGHKILLRGNHDPRKFSDETLGLLEGVYDYLEISDTGRKVILCHYPIPFFKNCNEEGYYMLYGHVHVSRENDLLEKYKREILGTASHPGYSLGNFINVGCMMPWMGYVPRTLDEIIEDERQFLI